MSGFKRRTNKGYSCTGSYKIVQTQSVWQGDANSALYTQIPTTTGFFQSTLPNGVFLPVDSNGNSISGNYSELSSRLQTFT